MVLPKWALYPCMIATVGTGGCSRVKPPVAHRNETVADASAEERDVCQRVQRETEATILAARRRASLGVPRPTHDFAQARAWNHEHIAITRRELLSLSPRDDAYRQKELYVWLLEHSMPEPDAFVDPTMELAVAGTCASRGEGTWAFEIETLDYDAERWHGRWVLSHYDREGTRVTLTPQTSASPPQTASSNCCDGYGVRFTSAPIFYDFDGDGEEEVSFRNIEEGNEGHYAAFRYLLTFRNGNIVPFVDPAIPIGDVLDADGDGTPDVVTSLGYEWSDESCATGFPARAPGPSFVLRFRNGRLEVDDETRASVGSFCPAPPRAIRDRFDALCARMWAGPAELSELRRRVASSCVPWSCEAELRGRGQPKNASKDCSARLAWFDRTPPVTLKGTLPDACRREVAASSTVGAIYEGKLVRIREDPESGFAHEIRWYCFEPLRAWRGVSSKKERCEAFFVPGGPDANAMPDPPRYTLGTKVLVETSNGGMTGRMSFLRSYAKTTADSAERLGELGRPCWSAARK